jgi:Putative auto-transporter adhesin, head GIN domain
VISVYSCSNGFPQFFETICGRVCLFNMKMMCLPVLCLGLMSFNGCNFIGIHGSGVAKTESRAVTSFSKIELAGSPDVEVTIGPATSVSVTADDNLLPIIETKVEGDTLKIGSKQSYNTTLGVKVKITVPALDGASVSGSGDIHVKGLKAADLEAGVTGSGDVTLTGVADRLHAQITGSGDLRAGDFAAKSVRVTVTGSGDATVQATEELDASVTGSGDVHYSGHPSKVRKTVTGSGDIVPR